MMTPPFVDFLPCLMAADYGGCYDAALLMRCLRHKSYDDDMMLIRAMARVITR